MINTSPIAHPFLKKIEKNLSFTSTFHNNHTYNSVSMNQHAMQLENEILTYARHRYLEDVLHSGKHVVVRNGTCTYPFSRFRKVVNDKINNHNLMYFEDEPEYANINLQDDVFHTKMKSVHADVVKHLHDELSKKA